MFQNVMAGGDSAARGIIIASLLSHLISKTDACFKGINAYKIIERKINKS